MPSHKVHTLFDRYLLGKSYWKIHRKMDKPYLIYGRKHRVFLHDNASAIYIAKKLYPNDQNAIAAALNHIYIDNMLSNDRTSKMTYQLFAEEDAKNRKKK